MISLIKAITALLGKNAALSVLLLAADVLLGCIFARKVYPMRSRRVLEAMGTRIAGSKPGMMCLRFAGKKLATCGERLEKGKLMAKARDKMKKAGYKSDMAARVYVFARYVFSPSAFLAALISNYPNVLMPAALALFINTCVEMLVSSKKRNTNLRLQKYIYKIYKFLHNQVTSGVKPTDAVRSVCEVASGDPDIGEVLVRMAARYELTLDVDLALEELRSAFDTHEVETLCIALKQGIDTGDNGELLAKQEDIMFKKYFNYIQAETDGCKNRSFAAAAVFVAIVAVMIIVPLLGDMGRAIGNIFIN